MDKLLTSDYINISRTAKQVERADFLDAVKARRPGNKFRISASPLIRFYGSTAILTFSIADGGVPNADGNPLPATLQHTMVLVNIGANGWRLASFHASIPPAQQ